MFQSPNLHHLSFLLLLLLLLHLAQLRSKANATTPISYETYIFPSSDYSDENTTLIIRRHAKISHGALQITPDTDTDVDYLRNKSGRVFFKNPFKLWEDQGLPVIRHVASFSTSFSINIYRPNNATPGEGLAFIIAPNTTGPPRGSYGGFLGLTNATNDGISSNSLVAVELDTARESYDPDDNHIGLNLNSVVSNITAPLAPFHIRIATTGNGTNYTVWIDYNGIARRISVYMAARGQAKPSLTVLNTTLDISNYIHQWSYFGFSASTGEKYQLNCVVDWNITVEKLPADDRNPAWWKWYLVGGLVLAAMVVAVVLLVVCYKRRKRVNLVDPSVLTDALKSLPGMPREFTFERLKKATNNFDKKKKPGEGGFGEVYKGLLPGENITVAVKKFSRDSRKGQDDFLAELAIINRLRHKHLVRLLGEFRIPFVPESLKGTFFVCDYFKGITTT